MKKILNKEWQRILGKERKFSAKKEKQNNRNLYSNLDKYIPQQLKSTLEVAFFKGFHLVFNKGDFLLTKVMWEEEHINDYKVSEYSLSVRQNKKSLRVFSKKAAVTSYKNLIVSGAEGVGLGLLGIGLPDILIFVGIILKSIYQISLDFGFDYLKKEERIFILKLIQGALETGDDFLKTECEINTYIELSSFYMINEDFDNQLKVTSNALSNELLYAKFIQGLPIVGVIGGATNMFCLHKINEYAKIKYNKRFLFNQIQTAKIL